MIRGNDGFVPQSQKVAPQQHNQLGIQYCRLLDNQYLVEYHLDQKTKNKAKELICEYLQYTQN